MTPFARAVLDNVDESIRDQVAYALELAAHRGAYCEPMPAVDDDGWSEGVHPLPGYLMKCCDCGLIHELDTHIARQTGPTEADGTWEGELVEDPDLKVQIRMRREVGQ